MTDPQESHPSNDYELRLVEWRVEWRVSAEYKRWTKQVLIIVGSAVILPLILLLIIWPAELKPGENRPYGAFKSAEALMYAGGLFSFLVAVGAYLTLYLFMSGRRAFRDARRVAEARRQLNEAEDVTEAAGELELIALWRATQKRLDYYHEIAMTQAEKSFRHSQWATIGGFAILVVAVAIAALSSSIGGAVASGFIGVAGAGLAGYLGKTFLRTQEKTSSQLQSYFSQPLVFSRHLAAERLIGMLDGVQKADSIQILVRAIASADSVGNSQQSPAADEGETPE